ncbi:serine/threonine-protein kinase [Actinoallomurus rhizosphaericola]|uniref:serine/threonine-protein kinase n=1 Tax=Actinoallomurus rhizosphaericola TaxID=2952536 RepID=UPI002093DB59|nr:serine/threonine protein kinase [Actinoallomurus rhizosphaericola]MCO5996725.1 protein kinase [Actinoallomurus rhizosphaericola]
MIDQVPGYRILERVGEGGFSVVYRAEQERLNRIVALKVLSVDAVDDDTMRRFERECQITGRLTGHPNVVTVLDTGVTSGGRPFIAMDYFERGSLRDRLSREGPLPLQDVLRAGVKIAGALAATHEAGVLHRDVKPQNILVSKYGEPALADFGIARLTGSSEVTHTTAFTPHHAAPEVVNGEQPGVTADVYSLASSMYQLLAGGPAFKSTGSANGIGALMMRILNEPPPPIPRADVPPQVYDVIAKAMAKTPAQRYPSAVAFAGRLQQLQAELGLPVTEPAGSDSVTAPPASTPYVPEQDHSGLTGPGFELLAQQYAPPHLPAAHPDAAGPGPASPPTASPRPAPPRTPDAGPTRAPNSGPAQPPAGGPPHAPSLGPTGAFNAGPTGAFNAGPVHGPASRPRVPDQVSVPRPREATPRTLPESVEPADLLRVPANGRKGRPAAVVAGVVAGVVVIAGAGVAGFLLFGNTGDGGRDTPTPAPTAPRTSGSSTPVAIPSQVMAAATPRDLRATDKGQIVVLRWKLAKNNDFPIWMQQSDGSPTQTPPQALAPRSTTMTVSGLDPQKGYCFTVGALVAIGQGDGQPATIAWAKPKCIRGATAR